MLIINAFVEEVVMPKTLFSCGAAARLPQSAAKFFLLNNRSSEERYGNNDIKYCFCLLFGVHQCLAMQCEVQAGIVTI